MTQLPSNDDDNGLGLFNRRCIWVNGPVIVGAGPSGLAVAASLHDSGVPFVVLERSGCIASLWQHRTYDRLKLHLPKRFCELPLRPFPPDFPEYPSRSQFLDYLASYAAHFDITPRFNHHVLSARFDPSISLWRIVAEDASEKTQEASEKVIEEYMCRWLVVATGENAECVIPGIEGMEEFGGPVVHACDYKSGEGYRGKKVLVVGCGNSGMELCLDLCHHGAFPSMVVRDSVHVLPREILGKSTFELAVLLMRWLPVWIADKILLALTWLVVGNLEKYGLRRPRTGPLELKEREGKTPVLDIGALGKIRSGEIKVVPGVKRFMQGGVEFCDARVAGVDAVVLATGYRSNVPTWLQETDFFSKNGFPKEPFPSGWKGKNGLYAVGFTRRGLSGASLDAVRIAGDIGKVWREETMQTKKLIACQMRCNPQS